MTTKAIEAGARAIQFDLHMVDYWFHLMDQRPINSMQRRAARETAYEYAYACGYLGAD